MMRPEHLDCIGWGVGDLTGLPPTGDVYYEMMNSKLS
jgi:hypothetical protein